MGFHEIANYANVTKFSAFVCRTESQNSKMCAFCPLYYTQKCVLFERPKSRL